MDKRPHPNYDRVTWRRPIVGMTAALLFAFCWWAAESAGAGDWVKWPGAAGMLAGFGIVVSTGVNHFPCPACRRPLSREPNTTEFQCQQCGISWVSRSFGKNFLE
jgi:predicted RNA-binding Zn-ribbon protein involved in translation (DUF1610 family)